MKLSLILLSFMVWAAMPLNAMSRFDKSADEKQRKAKDIVRFSHEPVQFGLRRGKNPESWPAHYEKMHSPENIRLMASLGARYERLHFYKGMGLEYEMPDIRKTARAAELMHELGMKLSVYVGGSMFVETFFRENPQAAGWKQTDQWGRFVPYLVDTQTFRHMPCPNSRGYRDYIKRVIDVGIDTVNADQFFFDNYFLRAEPKSCRCERCMNAFHEYLREKYPTKEEAYNRFGYPDTDWIQVNEWDDFNRPEDVETVDDPVLQEWVRFRCESLADQCREFYDYIKSRNPKLSAGFNLKGLYSLNRYWYNAVYQPLFADHCDFFCFDIPGVEPGIHPETGALVSEIRSYKIARRLNMACSNGSPGVQLAEQMAFNNQKYLEGFGFHGAGYNHYAQRVFSPLAEFFREYNDRFFTHTDNVTDCAILRSWPSMAYSVSAVWTPVTLMEQTLIQHRVPFDIIFDMHMDSLERYKAVILAGQESLSMENIEKLRDFMQAGGTVVFTGNTADFNCYRRMRETNPLLTMMGLDRRPPVVVTRKVGVGKLVYIPEVIPALEPESWGRWDLPPWQWVLPSNHGEIVQAIERNIPGGFSLRAEAPLTTAAEILNRDSSRETIVHFVNYDYKNRLIPFRTEVRPQYGKVKKVEYYSCENDNPSELEYLMEDGQLVFTLPETGMYAMVVISY
ncbi:beta-galactosidase [Gemmatimonadota bacterium]